MPNNANEDRTGILLRQMRNLEPYAYADSVSRNYGDSGKRNGLYVALRALSGDQILSELEAEAERNIANEKGLEAVFKLSDKIRRGKREFFLTALELNVEDVVEYIREPFGEDVEIILEEKYKNTQLRTLSESEEDEEKNYATYLLKQLENAVQAKLSPVAYAEKAIRVNRAYREQKQQRED